MKRIHALGLCLVAAIAFSALATASASAAPEYGQCQKLTKESTPKAKHGKYQNSGCTVHSKKCKTKKGVESCTEEEKGEYEWYPGPSSSCQKVKKKKGKYEDSACTKEKVSSKGKDEGEYERRACKDNNCAGIESSGGTAFLEGTKSHIKIECSSNGSEDGEILTATEATGIAWYRGCHIEALGVSCKSENTSVAGEIKTFVLKAEPVETTNKKGEKIVATKYTPKMGTYLAEFNCEAIRVRVKGFADGLVKGGVNEMSVTSTQTFNEEAAPQGLISEHEVVGEGKGYEEPEESFQHQTSTFTSFDGTEGMEIRT
jgi:hypothetical protein